MAKTRRKYKGNATTATISAGLSAGAVSAVVSVATGWPTSGPFYCVVSPGTSSEEKILVGSISGTTISSLTRGVDDTTDQTHAAGCSIYPVFTAVDADEANELTASYTTRGDIVYQGASTFTRLGVGSADQVLKTNGTDPSWGQVATGGIADDAVTAAKIATGAVGATEIADGSVGTSELADGSVTSAKILDGTIVNADINASAAIELSKLATGALPTAITVASANLVDGTIVNADVNASAAIAYSKLALSNSIVAGDITAAAVTNAKLNNGSSGDVALVTVSTDNPTLGKNGDIWVKVV